MIWFVGILILVFVVAFVLGIYIGWLLLIEMLRQSDKDSNIN